MRNNKSAIPRILLIVLFMACSAAAQTPAFTYQGQLSNSGTPANSNFDFQFTLFDLAQNGSQQGQPVTALNVSVVNGVFTVQINFGSGVFTANTAHFMQIGVRPTNLNPQVPAAPFTTLSPLVPITSTPYAIRTLSAATADSATTASTATNATQLGGVAANQYVQTNDPRLSDARTPTGGSVKYIQNIGQTPNAGFSITGNAVVGGTMSANSVNSSTAYNIGNSPMLSSAGTNSTSVGTGFVESGFNNTMVGRQAGAMNFGFANTFVGALAGQSNEDGGGNTFFGTAAGNSNTRASNNSFIGASAGLRVTTGQDNTFLGFEAGVLSTSGSGNTFLGSRAGENMGSGANNTFIGFGAGTSNAGLNLTQSTAIGAGAQVTTSNTIVLGTKTEITTIPGQLAIQTLAGGGANSLCTNPFGQVGSCSSSLRYKTDLAPYNRGLDLINRLRPISFTWKSGGMRDLGFGAEDVAKIEPLLVTYNAQGQVEGLKYDRITVAMVNAVKEQQSQISEQQKQIESLRKLICADHPGADVCRQN